MGIEDDVKIRILCQNLVLIKEVGLRWLIGSPFLPPVTVVSTLRCLHTQASDSISPNLPMELDEVRGLLPGGLEVIGAVIAHDRDNLKKEKVASLAISAVRNFRKILYQDDHEDRILIGAVLDLNKADVDRDLKFYVSRTRESDNFEKLCPVVYIDQPEKEIWKNGCLVCCEIPLKMPLYYTSNNPKDLEVAYGHAIENVRQKLTVPQIAYIIEAQNKSSDGPGPIILHGMELDLPSELPENAFSYDTSQESFGKSLTCSYFFPGINDIESFASMEKDTDIIRVSIMLNRSKSNIEPVAPLAEYYPANGEAKLMVLNHKVEVVSYAAKDLQLTHVVSKLIIPAIIDQLYSMKNKILPDILKQHPLLQPYLFVPPGFLHPITVIYDLSYGETEIKQVEIRKSLHLRLGLPFDRPLLRVANGINLSRVMDNTVEKSELKGSFLLKDVHHNIPGSGVSGGNASLIQGSYEYYHYMQDGFDDSGWGCAYRSLQSIISWFRLQHYTSIDVPLHREIQQSLVDIGDKDPSFVGSREWIGAIELSFVLDKLLGVSCKIINVRSGIELPEKCRELALHFETQGTPVMIGGGVLAYTLLGVDYDEVSGDCAFLILDPHYTGNEDLKKIVNGGWCAWKKAVDSKGKYFFLPDKFYNLLLPQRPNIV